MPLPTPGQPRKTHWTFLSFGSLRLRAVVLLKVKGEEGGLVVSDEMAAEEEEEDMNLLKCESDDEVGFERRVRVAAIVEL